MSHTWVALALLITGCNHLSLNVKEENLRLKNTELNVINGVSVYYKSMPINFVGKPHKDPNVEEIIRSEYSIETTF